jgi:Pectate lyase superfamily protein/Concanavalin A-like lectin/glucanases superfamily
MLLLVLSHVAAADTLRLRMEEATGAADVPAPYIYDPMTKTSAPNTRSRLVSPANPPLERPAGMPKSGSFTLEAFVKPTALQDGVFAGKGRKGPEAAEFGLKLFHFSAHRQYYFRSYLVPPNGSAEEPGVGYYGSAAQWEGEKDTAWRHVALVYDQEKKTITAYVDSYLSAVRPVTEKLSFDDAPLIIGGGKFTGLVDEVRLTNKALPPSQFLHAVSTSLAGVSYESAQQIVPRDAGCSDVKEHFGAVGDGRTDDTAAFNRAFRALCSRVPLAYHTLIIPPGTYLISDVVQGGRFIDVKGAGPGKTILKLKDGVFKDPAQPLPILRMSSTHGPSGSEKTVNGSSICIYLEGLTLDTGKGNPGARGLEYHANNLGRLENVLIRSGDGTGVCGLDLTHRDCGPALVKNVLIEGFDHGIHARGQEYSMTFEQVRLRGQKKAGILNQGNIMAIRRLTSENSVPALVCEGANTMVSLLDSTLTGSGAESAIRSEGGLYALRVKTSGYANALTKRILVSQKPLEWRDETVAGPDLAEYVGDKVVNGFGTAKGALKLPIEETPAPLLLPVSEWVSVAKFSDRKVGDDWSPAVQAAIESGARIVYFPRTMDMLFKTPIRLHGKLERLIGFGGEVNWDSSVWKHNEASNRDQTDPAAAPPPILIFDEPNPQRTIVLDRLGCVHLQHASPATLVLRSSTPGRYSTAKAGGKLFAEDVGGADWHFDHPQRVWIRQWNVESHAAGPCIQSKGATIWALGFKTEYESQKMLAEAGASTEILGAFVYPIGKIPDDRPIFENKDSRMSLSYGTSVYAANHNLHIRDTRLTETKMISNDAINYAGSRGRMDLFTTDSNSLSR